MLVLKNNTLPIVAPKHTAIESYLASRERAGERLQKEAPLIREQFDPKDLLAIKHPKHLVLILSGIK